jgi:hypothetical protein
MKRPGSKQQIVRLRKLIAEGFFARPQTAKNDVHACLISSSLPLELPCSKLALQARLNPPPFAFAPRHPRR